MIQAVSPESTARLRSGGGASSSFLSRGGPNILVRGLGAGQTTGCCHRVVLTFHGGVRATTTDRMEKSSRVLSTLGDREPVERDSGRGVSWARAPPRGCWPARCGRVWSRGHRPAVDVPPARRRPFNCLIIGGLAAGAA